MQRGQGDDNEPQHSTTELEQVADIPVTEKLKKSSQEKGPVMLLYEVGNQMYSIPATGRGYDIYERLVFGGHLSEPSAMPMPVAEPAPAAVAVTQ